MNKDRKGMRMTNNGRRRMKLASTLAAATCAATCAATLAPLAERRSGAGAVAHRAIEPSDDTAADLCCRGRLR